MEREKPVENQQENNTSNYPKSLSTGNKNPQRKLLEAQKTSFDKLLRSRISFYSFCSYLDLETLLKLRLSSKKVKSIIDTGISRILLINKNFSSISCKVDNLLLRSAKKSDYLQLYSKLKGSSIRSKITSGDLQFSYVSSVDYDQSAKCMLDGDHQTFYSSKGNASPDSSEFMTICLKHGSLINLNSLKIKFYTAAYFEETNNFFPADSIYVRMGLFEHGFEKEYGPFDVKGMLAAGNKEDKTVELCIGNETYLAKYIQIEFRGLPGLQLSDNKYYLAIEAFKMNGFKFQVKTQEADVLVDLIEAYYQKNQFFEKVVGEYYKSNFERLYHEVLKEKLENMNLREFVLGDVGSVVKTIHLPALEHMIENEFDEEIIFQYLLESNGLRDDPESYKFFENGGEKFKRYLRFLEPRLGNLNTSESRLVFEIFYYKPFMDYYRDQNTEKLSEEKFSTIVSDRA